MKKLNYQSGIGPIVVILILAIVAAIGGGVYYSKKAKMDEQKVEENTEVEGNAEVKGNLPLNAKGTIREIFALGKNSMCTFSGASAQGSVSGTMYISKDMARGDFVMTQTGKTAINSSMIRQNSNVYMWSGTQGATMSFGDINKAAASQNMDIDQKIDYKCVDWTPDQSKFAVPTTVKFVNLEAMLKAKLNLGQ